MASLTVVNNGTSSVIVPLLTQFQDGSTAPAPATDTYSGVVTPTTAGTFKQVTVPSGPDQGGAATEYTPAQGFTGVVTVTMTDQNNNLAADTLTITVTAAAKTAVKLVFDTANVVSA